MSSALKIARRYKNINSIGLHFERSHISVVVKAGCNLRTLLPARRNLSLKSEYLMTLPDSIPIPCNPIK